MYIYPQSYDEEEEGEPNLFQKLALHWRTAGPRLVFLGAFLLMVTLVCCSCLRLACRFWCKSMQDTSACCFLPGVKEMCQSCYTDPSESTLALCFDQFNLLIVLLMPSRFLFFNPILFRPVTNSDSEFVPWPREETRIIVYFTHTLVSLFALQSLSLSSSPVWNTENDGCCILPSESTPIFFLIPTGTSLWCGRLLLVLSSTMYVPHRQHYEELTSPNPPLSPPPLFLLEYICGVVTSTVPCLCPWLQFMQTVGNGHCSIDERQHCPPPIKYIRYLAFVCSVCPQSMPV